MAIILNNGILVTLLVLAMILSTVSGLRLAVRTTVRSFHFRMTSTTDEPTFEKWYNPKYQETEIDSWYIELDKALLTVGAKGVTPSGINSLTELLKQHKRVKVKIASDRLDPIKLSEEFASSDSLKDSAELLQVRKRGFLFLSKTFVEKPFKPRKPRPSTPSV